VGCFSYVAEGQYLVVRGEMVTHREYGEQIKMSSYEEKQPGDSIAVERHLGSGAIKGIGPALASRIVRKFGEDTFRIMEEEPERLAEVKGISQKMAMNAAVQFNEKRQMRQAMIFLQEYGINMNLAVKIYRHYGEKIYETLRNNPYQLAEDISGVGFKIADEIARQAGFYQDSAFRIQAGIIFCLQQSTLQGHCYLPESYLLDEAARLLEINRELVEQQIDELSMNRQIVCREIDGEKCLYYGRLYYMEMDCARMLLDLNLSFPVREKDFERKVREIEKAEQFSLDTMQKKAVFQAVQNGVMIIMGGPGTGKTTTINTIVRFFEEEGMDILLGAPTGRAAKRMSETTGYEAQTIHRLLEINGVPAEGEQGRMHFERNELQPLEADVVVIDEMSMVDIYLLHALLRALVPGTRLIMVGDVNQLPSVGPGNVLKDMIMAKFCNVVRLDKVFRQAAESDIILNAHKINRGQPLDLKNNSRDFFHLERDNSGDVINVVIQLIMQKLPPYVNAKPYDIQVLCPMRKGELGIIHLNEVLQRYLNPATEEKREREFHGVRFREGDKIMQIKNDYQLKWKKRNPYGDVFEEGEGVFNGDCGIIREISNLTETVTVEFEEGKIAEYEYSDMDELELAYAITIHKSQGSEYPAVILPLLGGPGMLLNRNLLYTAVTRAKKCVTIVGRQKNVEQMIANVNEKKRYSGLCQKICDMQTEISV
jgi:exodeoxyribonuclease V alpha subunit